MTQNSMLFKAASGQRNNDDRNSVRMHLTPIMQIMGEALITLTVFMLHVPLALMRMKVIWDRYISQTKSNQNMSHRARLK